MDELYLDTIIDRYKHPTNKGKIAGIPEGYKLEKKTAVNTSCGDQFSIEILFADDIVVDAKWSGEGCAISTVSVDSFCEWMVGKKRQELVTVDKRLINILTGIEEITPAREKCLYLSLRLLNSS